MVGYDSDIFEFDFGKIKTLNFCVNVLNKDEIKINFLFMTLFSCDGIIGWDLLQKFDFTIDYKNKQLVLRKPIEKNNKQRNIFWNTIPIVKFYSVDKNYLLLFFFDSGCGVSSFDINKLYMFELDTNYFKTTTKTTYGGNGNVVKAQCYKYFNFECFTIFDNRVNYLKINEVLFENIQQKRYAVATDIIGVLGSDWFKDKAVRVDMLNGIFEILE